MKQRILSDWNFTRSLYVVAGLIVIINAATNKEWFAVLAGSYLASMGIFAFGCAAGNCFSGACKTELIHQSKTDVQEINLKN